MPKHASQGGQWDRPRAQPYNIYLSATYIRKLEQEEEEPDKQSDLEYQTNSKPTKFYDDDGPSFHLQHVWQAGHAIQSLGHLLGEKVIPKEAKEEFQTRLVNHLKWFIEQDIRDALDRNRTTLSPILGWPVEHREMLDEAQKTLTKELARKWHDREIPNQDEITREPDLRKVQFPMLEPINDADRFEIQQNILQAMAQQQAAGTGPIKATQEGEEMDEG
jgi:hypothetical protein